MTKPDEAQLTEVRLDAGDTLPLPARSRIRFGFVGVVITLIVAGGCSEPNAPPDDDAGFEAVLPLPRDVPMGFDFSYFPDLEAYEAELRRLKKLGEGQFEFFTDRMSYDGAYPLYWITVGDTSKPAVFFVAVLHAKNEKSGAHILLRFVEKLLDPNDDQAEFNRKFLEHYSLVAIPIANPWGYFASPDGKHHNAHPGPVVGIEAADWHDMTNYSHYSGVDLNRNFDWNWEAYPRLPWSVREYWNGQDYGNANYFMAPFYLDKNGAEVYDEHGEHENHILKPDPAIYDFKGAAPFSEPETQLIRDLVLERYPVVAFADWHNMNPWQDRNATKISGRDASRPLAARLVDEGIARVNARHPDAPGKIPACRHVVMEDYAWNGPYSANWARNAADVISFGWETGTKLPVEVWTDAYMEMYYRSIYWMLGTLAGTDP